MVLAGKIMILGSLALAGASFGLTLVGWADSGVTGTATSLLGPLANLSATALLGWYLWVDTAHGRPAARKSLDEMLARNEAAHEAQLKLVLKMVEEGDQ